MRLNHTTPEKTNRNCHGTVDHCDCNQVFDLFGIQYTCMVGHSISMVQCGFLRYPDKEIWLTKVLRNRIVHTEARVSWAKKTVHLKTQKHENYIFLIWIQTCGKSKLATGQVARYFSFWTYLNLLRCMRVTLRQWKSINTTSNYVHFTSYLDSRQAENKVSKSPSPKMKLV